ncbi:hypothetical protein GQF61_02790 [Sphingobacterium sp. DK4209]|uniref:WG repeat-containing protein n=1 Tax=Sphingobacterium zhuxiongii TaxID=2662364 RepID=A0A5Q0QC56_9SPHI|nr:MULTISPECIES: WG repeat-containing protein [unclassified Sphingobacterium]MVZ64766.1 hypothetical protein [Sphingobacterium sp. DK4209]QGA27096.1 hypothetical protein GFH32_12545 [Sphingobacterium sp. dk4302]
MKSIILSLSLSLISLGSTYAQVQKLFKLDYQYLLADQDAAAELENAGQFQSGYVNKKYIKIVPNDGESPIYVSEKDSKKSFMLFPASQEFFVVNSGEEAAEVAEELGIEYIKGKTKKIAGYDCKFGQVKIDSGEEGVDPTLIELWYTEAIPAIYWGEFEILSQVPGAVLEFSVAGNGFTVTKIANAEMKQADFSIPEDYTALEISAEAVAEDGATVGLAGTEVAENRVIYSNDEQSLYGLADSEGNHITSLDFTHIDYFFDGQAIVANQEGKFGTIDLQGKPVIACQYDYLGYDDNSEQYMYSINEKTGLLNKNGTVAIKADYDQISFITNGMASAMKDEKWGIIDETGKVIIPFQYEMIFEISKANFTVYENEKLTLYNLKTNKMVGEEYDYISLSQDSPLITVQKDDKFGFINPLGKVVIPFKYTVAGTFENGQVVVAEDAEASDHYIINMKGERVEEQ